MWLILGWSFMWIRRFGLNRRRGARCYEKGMGKDPRHGEGGEREMER